MGANHLIGVIQFNVRMENIATVSAAKDDEAMKMLTFLA